MYLGPPSDRLFYIHVRKSGGTTLSAFLSSVGPKRGPPWKWAQRLERGLCALGLPVPSRLRAQALLRYKHWPTFWVERYGLLKGTKGILFNVRDPLQTTASSLRFVTGHLPTTATRRAVFESFLGLHAGSGLESFRHLGPEEAMRVWMAFQDFSAHYSVAARREAFRQVLARGVHRKPLLAEAHRHSIPNVLGGLAARPGSIPKHYRGWRDDPRRYPRLGLASLWLVETLYRRPWELLAMDESALRRHFSERPDPRDMHADIYPHRILRLESLAEDLRALLLELEGPAGPGQRQLASIGHELRSEGPPDTAYYSEEYRDWTRDREWLYYRHFPHYLDNNSPPPEVSRAG